MLSRFIKLVDIWVYRDLAYVNNIFYALHDNSSLFMTSLLYDNCVFALFFRSHKNISKSCNLHTQTYLTFSTEAVRLITTSIITSMTKSTIFVCKYILATHHYYVRRLIVTNTLYFNFERPILVRGCQESFNRL